MKSATLYINGYIGQAGFFDDASFDLKSLNAFIDENKGIDELNVFINSGGGSVTEGFAIHDRLMALPYTVNTIVNGMCGSIATVIFQAGKKGKRKMYANSEFFVHNPFWMPDAPNAMEAKDLEALTEDLKRAENKIVNFYSTITGKSTEDLKPILDRQTTLTADEAIELGFADEIMGGEIKAFTKYKIAAYLNTNNKTITMTDATEIKAELGLIKTFLATIKSKLNFKAAMTETVDKKAIYFDGSTLTEGVAVFEDETMLTPLADGDYTIDVATYTVVGGVVTAVKEVEVEDAKLKEANATIEDLKAQLAAKDAIVNEKETLVNETKEEIVALATKVKSFEAMLVTGKDFKADAGQNNKGKTDEPKLSAMEQVAKKRAEKENK
jgi:ATP-dependent Clp protease protease subunit